MRENVRRGDRLTRVPGRAGVFGSGIRAANREAGTNSPVVVSCWEAPERFEVCVADGGSGFDPEDLPEHPPVTDPDRLNFERGLGIPLIRSLVDDVRFESGPDGTSVWMTLFGAPVVAVRSMGPITRVLGLNFTAWSYGDDFSIGLQSCVEFMPDLRSLGGHR